MDRAFLTARRAAARVPSFVPLSASASCGGTERTSGLAASVQVAARGRTWSYTLANDEPAGSPHFIKLFQLDVKAPFRVTGTPPGWAFETDNRSSVLWFSTDEAIPHPNDVPPAWH